MIVRKNKVIRFIVMLLALLIITPFSASVVMAEPVFKTTAEAASAAKAMGFQKINETVHGGQAVFKKGRQYISRDFDGHKPDGAWKMASSVKKLGSKSTRDGTFSADLKTRVGD